GRPCRRSAFSSTCGATTGTRPRKGPRSASPPATATTTTRTAFSPSAPSSTWAAGTICTPRTAGTTTAGAPAPGTTKRRRTRVCTESLWTSSLFWYTRPRPDAPHPERGRDADDPRGGQHQEAARRHAPARCLRPAHQGRHPPDLPHRGRTPPRAGRARLRG